MVGVFDAKAAFILAPHNAVDKAWAGREFVVFKTARVDK
jgi:hypothetical protein